MKIRYHIHLVNSIYKANIRSLLKITDEHVSIILEQNEAYIAELLGKKSSKSKEERDKSAEYFAHLANIDWLLINSIYIASFSHFERHLFKLASIVEERTKERININDMSDKGVRKYRKYLDLVGKLDGAKHTSIWQQVEHFQEVRNILAHNGGQIIRNIEGIKKLEQEPVFKFLEKHEVIMAGSLGHIRMRDTKFLKEFSKCTHGLSDALVKEILTKYPAPDD